MNPTEHWNAALRTVADACRIGRSVQHNLQLVRQITKDDQSPVTVADFAVQAIIALELQEALGTSVIVGEENSSLLRASEQRSVLEAVVEAVRTQRPATTSDEVLTAIDACNHDATADAFWTLDPIDGTKGFLRGQQYAIALARIERGTVVLGVMGCPNLSVSHSAPLDQAHDSGVIYSAAIGEGAWEHRHDDPAAAPRRIHAAMFDEARPVRACESVEASHSRQDVTARVLRELGAPGTPARLDSQCKYVVVARGQADAYLRLPTQKAYVEKIWDHAAGSIIASEAGAIVSDISGEALDFSCGPRLARNRGIVCAAAGLHPRIIDVIDRLAIGAAV